VALTAEDVRELRRRVATGEQIKVASRALGLPYVAARAAARGLTYRDAGGPITAPDREEHGLSRTPEYKVWSGIIKRCTRPTSRDFPRYGGAGISICSRWRESFPDFLSDVGHRPSATHSIERIDVLGDYEPSNVRWATDAEQRRNKRTTRMLEFGGDRLCVADMARKHGLVPYVVYSRLRSGWTVERALTTPVAT
jgi:hypothetical protein